MVAAVKISANRLRSIPKAHRLRRFKRAGWLIFGTPFNDQRKHEGPWEMRRLLSVIYRRGEQTRPTTVLTA